MRVNHLELTPDKLRRSWGEPDLPFQTTAELDPLDHVIGQDRAVRAIRFGLEIERPGYNIYVSGLTGTGRTTIVRRLLEKISAEQPAPDDWVLVHNFEDPDRPVAISLPVGEGCALQRGMNELIRNLRAEIPKTFESEEYKTRQQEVLQDLQQTKQARLDALEKKAVRKGFKVQATMAGFQTVPLNREGEVMNEEEFEELPDDERKEVEQRMRELRTEIQEFVHEIRELDKEARQRVNQLNREIALFVVGAMIEELRDEFRENKAVMGYLDAVQEDIVANVTDFNPSEDSQAQQAQWVHEAVEEQRFVKYRVNVLVDNRNTEGAPVIFELNPTFNNLFGRIEKKVYFGALYSDFTGIKAGSLLRANGGYLMVRVEDVLRNFFVWEGLKRALQNRELRIEDVTEQLGYLTTVGPKPEPIPLQVKVVMVGSPFIFSLLQAYDDDFGKIFRVKADFDYEADRNSDRGMEYARFIRRMQDEEGILPFDRGALSVVLEEASRLVEDQEKVSVRFGDIANLIREADHFAREVGVETVQAEHVRKAIEEKEYRSNLMEEKIRELIARDILLVDVDGAQVGQVNGLAVYDLGDFRFGKPSRITAQSFLGKDGVINIERKAGLSSSTHDKGVLILSGYLGGKYANDQPLALSASLAFEQSYEGVSGDSASSTELYALLSSLAGVPIRQGIAVTGSVNQRGEVQAIGGVNEKIEGFYFTCKVRGLTGDQGVIIPEANVEHLMLRDGVIQTVRDGKFHIWPVRTIDQGLEILTGESAGERQADGTFPDGTLNYKISKRLQDMAEKARSYEAAILTEGGDEEESRGGGE